MGNYILQHWAFWRNHYATAQYFGVITCFKDIYYGNTAMFFEEPKINK